MFKLNSVAGQHNWKEDMNNGIDEITPFRWEVRHTRDILQSITKCSQTHPRCFKFSCSMAKTLDRRPSAMRENW